jgi:predicted 3-demethylubiquinone-9 3-methyltransferase (glyoxalase superfamily)
MSNKIYPCLWFDGMAKEAADFYKSSFGNADITSSNPMVTEFALFGQKFIGLNGGPMFKPNPSISFFVLFDSESEIDAAWKKLMDGGVVMMALDKYPWSDKYGWLQDKFGISWQLMMSKPGMSEQKIIPALMFTESMAGKAEPAMQFYTSIFSNSGIKDISRYEKGEPDVEDTVKHGRFELDKQMFIAFDSSYAHGFAFNEAISLTVSCDTQEQIDYYWNELLKNGGHEQQCGWLKDQYGVSWQIVPAILPQLMNDPAKGTKVIEAFMKMKKFDIVKLLEAAG